MSSLLLDEAAIGIEIRQERQRRDLQRTFQLMLATVWLLDAVLQIQPFMFTRGSSGFSGMLHGLAAGNPSVVARMITWNASVVYHQPVLTNTLFALIQFLIAFGIIHPRTIRPALVLSIVWALGVWWFGEGAGGIFQGAATPFGGGPGAVLFYALLAVLLWPGGSPQAPFVAAQKVGVAAAKRVWVVSWSLLAVLSVVGSGRQPGALRDLVTGLSSGEPGWLAHIDKVSAAFLFHHATMVAVLLGALCVLAALSVYATSQITQVVIVAVVVVFGAMWVAVQNFGGILAGGATDPNSGPLIILFALSYWPLMHRVASPSVETARSGTS